MKPKVSIDKWVIEYKGVTMALFYRLYMNVTLKCHVKEKIYTGTYAYELHIRKKNGVYLHVYYKNPNEKEGHTFTLRVESRPEYYAHFKDVFEILGERTNKIEFVSCDVAYDIQTGLENIVVIPTDARRKMSYCKTTRYFGKPHQRKQNGYCRIYDKRLELLENNGIEIEHELSRIEIVYKQSEKIQLYDIGKYPPKQNEHYFASIIINWDILKKKQVERIRELRDGEDMHTQYIRREIKKTLTNQYILDLNELVKAEWGRLIKKPCEIVMGIA